VVFIVICQPGEPPLPLFYPHLGGLLPSPAIDHAGLSSFGPGITFKTLSWRLLSVLDDSARLLKVPYRRSRLPPPCFSWTIPTSPDIPPAFAPLSRPSCRRMSNSQDRHSHLPRRRRRNMSFLFFIRGLFCCANLWGSTLLTHRSPAQVSMEVPGLRASF